MTEEVASGVSSLTEDLTAVLSATDASERWRVLVDAFSGRGFRQLTYGFADIETSRRPGLYVDLSMAAGNAELLRRYLNRDSHPHDPLMKYLRSGRLTPLPFDIDDMSSPPAALLEIRAYGLATGVLIPLPALSGCPVAALIVGSERTYAATLAALQSHGDHLVALTHLFHASMAGEMRRRRDGATALSPREQACLQDVARGDRVAAIAHRLGLAEATVELHLRNTRRKLGARSLPEAVARALLYGQIQSA